MMNEQLISELPELLDLRIPYFDPSFEAMIRMQCKFAEEGYEKLGGVQRSASFCSLVAASLTTRTASSLLFFSLLDTSTTAYATTMRQVNWMHRYVLCRTAWF